MKTQKIAFYTLGCKVNQYETELIREQFLKNKYKIVPFSQIADIYVLNTCTVTAKSDRKSRYYIQKALRKSHKAKIVITGCYANRSPEDLIKISPRVLIIPNQEKKNIINYFLPVGQSSDIHKTATISTFSSHSRSFVKIQDGCDAYCSYCVVPYVRNILYSRPLEEILGEIRNLVNKGCKEIVLTGIRLGKYKISDGKSQIRDGGYQKENGENGLVKLIKLIHKIENLDRIRLSSIEPLDISEELIDAFSVMPKLCHHLHIPLQSGDDEILEKMNRKYGVQMYQELIDKIQNKIPDVNITTDVLVGFPGEKENNFKNTYNFVEKMNFGKLHVFKFSSRKETAASKLSEQIDYRIIDQRSKELLSLSKNLTKKFYSQFLNRNLNVLIESKNRKTSFLSGWTDNYIRVQINQRDYSMPESGNELVQVKIEKADDRFAYGEIV